MNRHEVLLACADDVATTRNCRLGTAPRPEEGVVNMVPTWFIFVCNASVLVQTPGDDLIDLRVRQLRAERPSNCSTGPRNIAVGVSVVHADSRAAFSE